MSKHERNAEAELGRSRETRAHEGASNATMLRARIHGERREENRIHRTRTSACEEDVAQNRAAAFRDEREPGDVRLAGDERIDQLRLGVPAEGCALHSENAIHVI